MGLDFSVVPGYFDNLLLGSMWTIAITLSAAVLSFFWWYLSCCHCALCPCYCPLSVSYIFVHIYGDTVAVAIVSDLFRID